MGKLNEMIEGYSNLLKIKKMSGNEQEVAEARTKICMECPHRREMTNTCAICGCYLPAKTKCMRCQCPLKYW